MYIKSLNNFFPQVQVKVEISFKQICKLTLSITAIPYQYSTGQSLLKMVAGFIFLKASVNVKSRLGPMFLVEFTGTD